MNDARTLALAEPVAHPERLNPISSVPPRRIGLVISTPDQTIASPFEVRPRRAVAEEIRYFRELARDYRLAGLVVGWPIHLSGEESEKSREARQFALWLAGVTGLPAGLWDERFTSAVAEEHLLAAELTKKRRKQRIDMLAAQILLQAFLDNRRARADRVMQ